MRFGICGSVDQIELVKELGYDYLELPLAPTAALPAEDFAALRQRVQQAGLPVEAFNIFFPRTIRLTGEQADIPAALAYARQALGRAAELGAKSVVFGSGGSRNVPDGFPMDRAWAQLVEVLHGLDPIAAANGIDIAIEHLNRSESNIITSLADGVRLAKEVARPNICVLVDSYHLFKDQEDPAVILQARGRLVHVHTARTEGRVYPVEPLQELRTFFAYLHQVGYTARVSIEGRTDDMRRDGAAALAVLRGLDKP